MSRDLAVRKAVARAQAKHGWIRMKEIPKSSWAKDAPTWAKKVFKNNRVTVIVQDLAGGEAGNFKWKAYVVPNNAGRDLAWREFQRIKNECFGLEARAIQHLPPESLLVDEVNVYWLYVTDAPLEQQNRLTPTVLRPGAEEGE